MGYASQTRQDEFLDQSIFQGFHGGVFVDVGAHDGVSFSNTVMFERNRGWTGVCIEPNPTVFPQLQANRAAVCLNVAIGRNEGELPFYLVDGYSQMLSGLVDAMAPRHVDRIKLEIAEHGGTVDIVTVPVRPLSAILREQGVGEVHYLSVDTEGNEPDVITSTDFAEVMVHVVTAEANYPESKIQLLAQMEAAGFLFAGERSGDLYFVNHQSRFVVNKTALEQRIAAASPHSHRGATRRTLSWIKRRFA